MARVALEDNGDVEYARGFFRTLSKRSSSHGTLLDVDLFNSILRDGEHRVGVRTGEYVLNGDSSQLKFEGISDG